MEVTDDSPFIPLSVFLHSMRGERSIDYPWVKASSEQQIGSIFKLSFPNNTPQIPPSSSASEIRIMDIGNDDSFLLRKSSPSNNSETPPTRGMWKISEDDLNTKLELLAEERKAEDEEIESESVVKN